MFEVADQLVRQNNTRVSKNCDSCNEMIHMDITLGATPRRKLYRDRKWLEEEYINKDRTLADISQQFGVSAMTISQWVRRHNLRSDEQ